MIRAIAHTLVFSGLGAVALAPAPAAAGTQFNNAPEVYSLSSGGHSYLGVDIQDVTADRVGPLKLKEERGVEVTTVDQDAPAGKAGIKEHDVILQFNGTAVESEEQLRRMLRETPAGRNVTLGISRDGNPMNITLQLADRGKIATVMKPKVVIPRMPEIEAPGFAFSLQTYSSRLGVQTENLSRQLGEYFGVKNGEGVLVRSVEKGSAAEKAGLKAGDVIVRADNEKLSDRADLSQVLRNHREGGKLNLSIMRDKHEQSIVVDLPNRSSDDSFWWSPSEDFDSDWSEIPSKLLNLMDELKPQMEAARQTAETQARAALMKARAAEPQLADAMRRAQEELRRAQREMEKHQREWRKTWNNMI